MSDPTPLSPSRASDFKTCPQLFKFRVVDRLPEPPHPASLRGTLVHAALEQMFRLPAHERTPEGALALLRRAWEELEQSEELLPLDMAPQELAEWMAGAEQLVTNYFRVEDPQTVEVQGLEWWVEHESGEMLLRGIIDRVEVLPDGEWMLVDYKTGASPSETYALGAFFGLRFYALLCWRAFGRMPKKLRLVHLREPLVLTLVPTEQMLEGLERQLHALAAAIRRAHERDDWRPRRGTMCNWCPHRALCPAWSSEAPLPVPAGAVARGRGLP